MILSVADQMNLFLKCVLIGGVVGVFYDCFVIIRRQFKHQKIHIHIEDLLFWLTTTFGIFVSMLKINEGEIREYMLGGIVFGYIVNKSLVSNFTVNYGEKFLEIVMYITFKIIKVILYPIKIVYTMINKVLSKFFKPVQRVILNNKNMLYKNKKYVKIKMINLKREVKILMKKI